MAASLFLVGTTRLAGIVHCPSEFVCLDYHMEHSAKVLLVEFIEDSLGIGKHAGVPGKRAVLSIPAGGAEPGPQVDQRVAGQFLVPKRFRLGHDFLAAGERAVGLLITKAPERRHLGITRQTRVFGHDRHGFVRGDKKNVER